MVTTDGPKPIAELFGHSPEEMVKELRRKQREFLKEEGKNMPTSESLAEKEAHIAKLASRRGPSSKPSRRQLNRADQARLPFWPDASRGVSNEMARSALFTVGQGKDRRMYKGEVVHSLKNVEILYTGEELHQRDLDVMLQLLHFGRLIPLGESIPFTARDMLTQLGWTLNSRSYQELSEVIDRLKNASVHIVATVGNRERGFSGSLVQSFAYHGKKGGDKRTRWQVTLEPRLAQLYTAVGYTQVEWSDRMQLRPTAKWLHTFYCTHKQPFPMKVATLYQLCGSRNRELWRFRNTLRQGLKELVKIGFLKTWSIDKTDLVTVVRNHEAAKLRKLARENASAG